MTQRKTIYTTLLFLFSCLSALGQVQAKFTADTTNGCTPVTVQFEDQSSGAVSSYYWTFGNGNTSTKKNPSAIFYKPGVYTVTLKVTDAGGAESTETKTAYIEVFELPTADFTPVKTQGCEPLDVPFTNKSKQGTGKIDVVTWDFGDGNTLISKAGFHQYKHAGTYSVSLLVVDENKCEDKIKKDNIITVWETPDVTFKSDENYSCQPPLDVNFTNTTKSNSGDTYLWDFGDGSSSTSENPKHTYTKTGSFTVTLTVTNAKGCKGKRVMKSFININPLDVDFDISSIDGCAPMEVSFTNKTTPDISGLTYKWDLGNGQTSQTKNVSVVYDKPGAYSISLSVSKNGKCGQKKTVANAISVKESPEPILKIGDTTGCKLPLSVDVEDVGKGSMDWKWLVDGTHTTSGKKSNLTFTSYGTYVVALVTENSYGCFSDTLKKIVRLDPIEVSATPDTTGCVPFTVTFTNTTDLGNYKMASQKWTFGDGASQEYTGSGPLTTSHLYDKDGIYTVKLQVTTVGGCTGEATLTVKVGKKRPPKIEEGIDTFCNLESGQILNLTNTALKDSIDVITWSLNSNSGKTSFGDKAKRDQFPAKWNFNFKVKEADTGYYSVTLITDDRGCKDTTILPNRIYVLPPRADLEPLHDTCSNDIMVLVDRSEYQDSINWVVNESIHTDTLIRIGTDTANLIWLRAYNFTSGCIDSMPFAFKPKPTFQPGFTANGDLCAPTSFVFNGRAPEPYLSYMWVINKTDTFHTRTVTYPMKQPGQYDVYYEVKDTSLTGGCTKIEESTINVTGPTVSGSMSGTPGCGPIDIKLTCNSNPKDFKRLFWLVGSDTHSVSSIGTKTVELYKPGPNDGKWPIRLVGIDSNGCQGSEDFEIEVYGTKDADLKISRFKDCTGRKFIFSPNFKTPVSDEDWTYQWDLGDGSSGSSLKVVNHTFAKPGKYAVKLFMTDEKGCVTRLQDTVDMEDEVLKARFFADSLIKDCPPMHVQFEDRSTLNGLRKIVKWEWDFGDGTGSRERYPSKLYLKAGNFDVSLKVTDEWGCKDSFTYPGFVFVNGPQGDYVFDKTEGCVPLDVTFIADTTRCSGFTWDFGDGNILKDQLKITHTYKDTGRFIPLLTLSDKFGCTYTHPPIDTIYVYPNPIPDFEITKPCPGVVTEFINTSWPTGSLANCSWEFGDGNTSDDCYPEHVYNKGGLYPVKLSVTTRKGCSRDTIKYLDIKSIEADFTTGKSEVCVGSVIDILDNSQSDAGLVSWQWTINDTFKYTGQNPSILFDKIGPVNVQLVIEDAIGCTDTLNTNTLLTVGDTVPPLPTDLLRVSVIDDYTYLVDYKKSTLSDFSKYMIYHGSGEAIEINNRDQTRCEVDGLNTLHNVYCSKIAVQNSCGLISEQLVDSNDCTVEVSAQGELNQSRLNWNPYFGWNAVEKYYIYREHIDTPGNYFLLDSVDGNTFEYVDTNILCYTKHRYKILSKELAGNNQVSWSDTCEAEPIYVNSLPPNKLVRATVQHDDYVRVEWLPTPFSKMPIDHYILEKSFDGLDYRVIDNQVVPEDFIEADDFLVEVDSQSYFYRVRAVDVCDDESPYSNLAKTILLDADTGKFQRPFLRWSKYKGWDEGVARYEVQRKEPDGSFYSMGYTNSGEDTTFYDRETELNERPHFCYRVIGYKINNDYAPPIISISNEDCVDVHSWLHVPNAFSPNGDGLNDDFRTPGWYIRDYRIRIYNRWGEKLFENESIYRSWDGIYNGEVVESEAYLYIIETIGIDNIKRNYKGTVTVVK